MYFFQGIYSVIKNLNQASNSNVIIVMPIQFVRKLMVSQHLSILTVVMHVNHLSGYDPIIQHPLYRKRSMNSMNLEVIMLLYAHVVFLLKLVYHLTIDLV